MTKIILIAPGQEVLVHGGMVVYDNESVKRINAFYENKLPQYGEIERILVSMGTVQIMDPRDSIPVPLKSGQGKSS